MLDPADAPELLAAILRDTFSPDDLERCLLLKLSLRLSDLASERVGKNQAIDDVVGEARDADWLAELVDGVRDYCTTERRTAPPGLEQIAAGLRRPDRTRPPDLRAEPLLPTSLDDRLPIFIASLRADRASHERVEADLRLGELGSRLAIVGRRQLDRDALPAGTAPRLARARTVVVVASPSLLASPYLDGPEGRELLASKRVVVVTTATAIVPEPLRLAAARGGDIEHIRIDDLAARLTKDPFELLQPREAPAEAREKYLAAFVKQLAAEDGDVRDVIEPTKELDELHTTCADPLEVVLGKLAPGPVALLGEPGSGKSLLLRRYGIVLAERANVPNTPRAPLPIYLRLRGYAGSADDGNGPSRFVDFVSSAIAAMPGALTVFSNLEQQLRTGKVTLLLDGLDEMPRETFEPRVLQIRRLIRELSPHVVIGSRTAEFDALRWPASRVVVRPFDQVQIAHYLTRNAGRSAAEAGDDAALLCHPDAPLAEAIHNPLLLRHIAATRQATGAYPSSLVVLFGTVKTEALSRLTGAVPAELERDVGRLAFAMMQRGGIGSAAPTSLPVEPPVPLGLIDDLVVADLLRRDPATGQLVFRHAVVQELFVADHVAAMPAPDRAAWLRAHCHQHWLEPVYQALVERDVGLDELASSVAAVTIVMVRRPDETTLRHELELDRHTARLAMMMRLCGPRFLPDTRERIEEALRLLWAAQASARPTASHVRMTLVRAMSPYLVSSPAGRGCLREALTLGDPDLRRHSLVRLSTGTEEDPAVLASIRRQAIATNYLRGIARELQAADGTALERFRPEMLRTRRVHVALLGVTVAAPLALASLTGTHWLFGLLGAIVVAGYHALALRGEPDRRPPSVTLLASCVLASCALGLATLAPEEAVARFGGRPDLRISSVALLVTMASSSLVILLAATTAWAPVRWLFASLERGLLIGTALGMMVAGAIASDSAPPRWIALATLMSCAILGALLTARVRMARKRRRLIWAVTALWLALAGIEVVAPTHGGGVLGTLLLGGQYTAVVVLILVVTTQGLETTRWQRAAVKSPDEAARHLAIIASPRADELARRNAAARLIEMKRPSSLVEVTLLAIGNDPRLLGDPVLSYALTALRAQRPRTPPEQWARVADELRLVPHLPSFDLDDTDAADRLSVAAEAAWVERLDPNALDELERLASSGDANAVAVQQRRLQARSPATEARTA